MSENVAAALLAAGATFMVISGIGILRMPDLYTRMSATSKAASLGAGLALAAVGVHFGRLDVSLRAAAAVVFVFLTVPVAAHMIARAAYLARVPLWRRTRSDDLAGRYDHSGPGAVAPPASREELGPGRRRS